MSKKVIEQVARKGELVKVRCYCNCVFWCNPISEKNLVRMKREQHIILVPCCPRCTHIDYEWAKTTYEKEKDR